MFKPRHIALIPALLVMAASLALGAARGQFGSIQIKSRPDEQKLIALLTSDEPKSEKALACKQLAVFGSAKAVPALAPLLLDKDLSSWARIALEAIPGPEADEALRQAMDKTQGRLLIGIINSIAVRRDARAVEGLDRKLKDADADVASSAAAALGRIGGEQAAAILEPALTSAPAAVRSAVAEGCIYCAESFLADAKREQAVKLYDAVRKAEVPKQRIAEATRGAILARQDQGLALLVEQLQSTDKAIFAVALRTARELQGAAVTDALIDQMSKATPERQALLILVLADRGDAKALPAVLGAAKSGPKNVRIVAAGVLERLGNVSCVPVLLEGASGEDAELAQAAKSALARLGGKDIDADLLGRLQQSSGKAKQVLVELAELRRIDGAMPIFLTCAQDADAGVRTAAIVALGALGDDKQAADLAQLLPKVQSPADRAEIEKALMSICGRWAAACVPHLLPVAQAGQAPNRIVALHALSCCGGPEALSAVKAALADQDEAVQDEAVRTLSTWPNRWPEDAAALEPLLSLAKSGKKIQHQVLAIRGYLQFVQGAKKRPAGERLAMVNAILPAITRPEEKRFAISAFSAIGTAGAIQPLMSFAADPATAEEACSAIIALTSKNVPGLSREQRTQALQTVAQKATSEVTRKRAEDMLKNGR